MLRILVVALVMLVAAMMLLPRGRDLPAAVEVATVLPEPRALPALVFTDTNGEPFSIDDLHDRYTLLFFGFTNCPDVCPLTLAVLAQARREIEAKAPALAPEVLFVSVDPARDSPDRIGAYLAGFDARFVGATTDEAALAPLIGSLGVTVHKQVEGDETYNVVHNGTIFVLDDEGRWIALFGGSSHDPKIVASDYLAIRRGT